MSSNGKVLMSSVYEMLANPDVSKADVLKFIKDITDKSPDLIEIFGEVSDDMISEVMNNESVIPNSKNDIYDFVEDADENSVIDENEFKILNVAKMSKDVITSIVSVPSKEEARYLEDIYYQMQRKRIVIENQLRALRQGFDTEVENHEVGSKNGKFLEWYLYNIGLLESQIKKALEKFSDSNYLTKWAKANIGIGPVISTCLVANLELKENTHASSWWDYCGLNNNNRPWLGKEKSTKIVNDLISKYDGKISDEMVMELSGITKWKYSYYEAKAKDEAGKWNKNDLIKATSMIPYNKNMKVLMYKIGHSFHLCKNNPDSLYGRLYKERFDYETMKNERGDYADQAAKILASKNFSKTTSAYKFYSEGKLPPAHIVQRCERYVTKMFISHLYEAAYYNKYGVMAPNPYVLCFCEGHTDYIGPEVPYESIERDSQ